MALCLVLYRQFKKTKKQEAKKMNKTGQDSRGGLYISRYHAKKEATGAEVVVKVSGGYKIMTAEDYKIWKMQK
jgi:effector-binding domain-containing protein